MQPTANILDDLSIGLIQNLCRHNRDENGIDLVWYDRGKINRVLVLSDRLEELGFVQLANKIRTNKNLIKIRKKGLCPQCVLGDILKNTFGWDWYNRVLPPDKF